MIDRMKKDYIIFLIFIYLNIRVFFLNKYLLSIFFVLGIVLGVCYILMNKIKNKKFLFFWNVFIKIK